MTDKYAYKIAKNKFNLPIKKIKNYYFSELLKKVTDSKKRERNQILYLNTAIKNKKFRKKNKIKYFLNKINHLKKNYIIKIKPHPNDTTQKYYWIKKTQKYYYRF